MTLRQVYAHNDLVQVAYELGLPGLALALAFIWFVLQSDRPERFVFLALIVEAIFAFPTHLATTGAIGALLAGVSVCDLPRVCLSNVIGRDRRYAGARRGRRWLQPRLGATASGRCKSTSA